MVRLDHGAAGSATEQRVGWEAVVFETDPPEVQRVVYRPAGWLGAASPDELETALHEAEAVRTRWQAAGN